MIPTSTWMSSSTKATERMLSVSPIKTLLTKGSVIVVLLGTVVMIGTTQFCKQHTFCELNPSKPSSTDTMKAISFS